MQAVAANTATFGYVDIATMIKAAAKGAPVKAVGVALIGYFSGGIDLSRWSAGIELAGLRSKLVPHLQITDVLAVGVMALMLGLLASAYPAWRAVQIKPLDALRR